MPLPPALEPLRGELVSLIDAWRAQGATGFVVTLGADRYPLIDGTDDASHGADGADAVDTEAAIEVPLRALGSTSSLIVLGLDGEPAITRLRADADLIDRLAVADTQLTETTSALVEINDQMLALYHLATSFSDSLSDVDMMSSVAKQALDLTAAQALLLSAPDLPTVQIGDETAARLLAELVDREELPRAGLIRRVSSGLDHDVLVVPLGHAQAGQLVLAGPTGGHLHTPVRKLATAIADQAGALFRLARFHRQELAEAKLQHDIETAAALSAQVLPKRAPAAPELDIEARNQPARLASGDYFTWSETGRGLVFTVGDVAGKGLPAAFVMAMMSTAANAAVHRDTTGDPGRILAEISAEVYDYLSDSGIFVTMAVGVWDRRSKSVSVVNAGHSPVLLRRRGRVTSVPPDTPPVGVLPDPNVHSEWYGFGPDDLVLIGSDGLVEQESAGGDQFGSDRLIELIETNTTTSAADLIDAVWREVTAHGDDRQQSDDRTALIVRRTGPVVHRTGNAR